MSAACDGACAGAPGDEAVFMRLSWNPAGRRGKLAARLALVGAAALEARRRHAAHELQVRQYRRQAIAATAAAGVSVAAAAAAVASAAHADEHR
jgi:hypothetical protein